MYQKLGSNLTHGDGSEREQAGTLILKVFIAILAVIDNFNIQMHLSLGQNRLQNSNLPPKGSCFSENDTLRAKLRLSQVKYQQLQSQLHKNKQQLLENQLTIKSLQTQVLTLKESLSKQELFHTKTVDYLNQEIKLRVKSQRVWIDYLKRENQFLKTRLRGKNSDSVIKDSEFEKINRNPINMLIWKIEEMSSERLNEESKFKKLLIPFFSALYKSKTTDELFEECIRLFRNCEEYETAITNGEKIRSIIQDFKREASAIMEDDSGDEVMERILEQYDTTH